MILWLWSRAMILPLWAGHDDARQFTHCRMIFLPWSCRRWPKIHDPTGTPVNSKKIRSPLFAAYAVSLNLEPDRLWDLYISCALNAVILRLYWATVYDPDRFWDLYISYVIISMILSFCSCCYDLVPMIWSLVTSLPQCSCRIRPQSGDPSI